MHNFQFPVSHHLPTAYCSHCSARHSIRLNCHLWTTSYLPLTTSVIIKTLSSLLSRTNTIILRSEDELRVVPSFDTLAFFLSWSSPRFSCYGLFSFLLALAAHPTLIASGPLLCLPLNQSSFAK